MKKPVNTDFYGPIGFVWNPFCRKLTGTIDFSFFTFSITHNFRFEKLHAKIIYIRCKKSYQMLINCTSWLPIYTRLSILTFSSFILQKIPPVGRMEIDFLYSVILFFSSVLPWNRLTIFLLVKALIKINHLHSFQLCIKRFLFITWNVKFLTV